MDKKEIILLLNNPTYPNKIKLIYNYCCTQKYKLYNKVDTNLVKDFIRAIQMIPTIAFKFYDKVLDFYIKEYDLLYLTNPNDIDFILFYENVNSNQEK